ncbi:MAG: hemerythrin [Burkholderiales bacterium]|jgi:hypothetical protein|nr:hemerythrin [Burkholderiales bacterium]
MTQQARKEIDALELLMQDHREVESLLREFEHLQHNGMNTAHVIATVCAELKMHDTLETQVFYAAVGEAADDEKIDRLLGDAEEDHDTILELIEKLEQTGSDYKERNARFDKLADLVKLHVLREETEHFPLVKTLERFDLDAVTAVMKKRKTALVAEMTIPEAGEETV